jgi:hypothetical protein
MPKETLGKSTTYLKPPRDLTGAPGRFVPLAISIWASVCALGPWSPGGLVLGWPLDVGALRAKARMIHR